MTEFSFLGELSFEEVHVQQHDQAAVVQITHPTMKVKKYK